MASSAWCVSRVEKEKQTLILEVDSVSTQLDSALKARVRRQTLMHTQTGPDLEQGRLGTCPGAPTKKGPHPMELFATPHPPPPPAKKMRLAAHISSLHISCPWAPHSLKSGPAHREQMEDKVIKRFNLKLTHRYSPPTGNTTRLHSSCAIIWRGIKQYYFTNAMQHYGNRMVQQLY